jgi:hypothetical protein
MCICGCLKFAVGHAASWTLRVALSSLAPKAGVAVLSKIDVRECDQWGRTLAVGYSVQ